MLGCPSRIVVSVSIVLACTAWLPGQEAPFDPNWEPPPPGPGPLGPTGVVGLVETTYSDSGWILAASDVILRQDLCSPSNWYDRISAASCHGYTRYWKRAPGATCPAYAYPMSSLGTGSFDGLYVKPGVSFQLYSGTGDANPFGPRMTGPKFVSLDHWRDTYPAPNGFEPGTFFVTGWEGALSSYSISLCDASDLLRVDSNNDGTVDLDTPAGECADPDSDDCQEDEAGLEHGLWLPVNNNDSDADGKTDFWEVHFGLPEGEPDRVDTRPLKLKFPSEAQAGWHIVLKVEDAEHAKRFRLYNADWQRMLGATYYAEDDEGMMEPSGPVITQGLVQYPGSTDWMTFHLEGVTRGLVRITAQLYDSEYAEKGSDTIKLNVFEFTATVLDGENWDSDLADVRRVSADMGKFLVGAGILFCDEITGEDKPAASLGSVVTASVYNVSGTTQLQMGAGPPAASLQFPLGGPIDGHYWVVLDPTPASRFQLAVQTDQVCAEGVCRPLSFVHRSPLVEVDPGPSYQMEITYKDHFNQPIGSAYYPASGTNRLTVHIVVTDEDGNPIKDGTEVEVALAGDGTILDASAGTSEETQGGEADIVLEAGTRPDEGGEPAAELEIKIGALTKTVEIHQLPIQIELSSNRPDMPVGSGQSAVLTAAVSCPGGGQIAPTTPVVWFSSLGSMSTGQGTAGLVAVSSVQPDSTSSAVLYTSLKGVDGLDVLGADVPGDARVKAYVGASSAAIVIPFTVPPEQLRVSAPSRVLVGDQTGPADVLAPDPMADTRFDAMTRVADHLSETIDCQSSDPNCPDRNGDGVVNLADLLLARNGTYTPDMISLPTATVVQLYGNPLEQVQVSFLESSQETYLGVLNYFVYLDANGRGVLPIHSKGTASSRRSITLRFQGEGTRSDYLRMEMVPMSDYSAGDCFVRGFFIGDAPGISGGAGDLLASACVYGDLRDLVIQAFVADEADMLVILLSTGGVFTTIFPVGDQVVGVLKVVAKKLQALSRLSRMKYIRPLVRKIKDVALGRVPLDDAWRLMMRMAADSNFLKVMGHSRQRVQDMIQRALNRFGESWAGYLTKVALNVSIAGVAKVARVLDAVDQAFVDLVTLGWRNPNRVEKLTQGTGKCAGKAVPDPVLLKTVVKGEVLDSDLKILFKADTIREVEDVITTELVAKMPAWNYFKTFDELIDSLGDISKTGVPGASEMGKSLAMKIDDYREMVALWGKGSMQANGALYSLKGTLGEVARVSEVARTPGVTLEVVGRKFFKRDTGAELRKMGFTKGEVDLAYRTSDGLILEELKTASSGLDIEQCKRYLYLAAASDSPYRGAKVQFVRIGGMSWSAPDRKVMVEIQKVVQKIQTDSGITIVVNYIPQ